jgi:hypothetical protein
MPINDNDQGEAGLDDILWGAEEIGRCAHLFLKKDGKIVLDDAGNAVVDIDKVYYKVRAGLLDVGRNGRELTSTPRRIRDSALNSPLKAEEAA